MDVFMCTIRSPVSGKLYVIIRDAKIRVVSERDDDGSSIPIMEYNN